MPWLIPAKYADYVIAFEGVPCGRQFKAAISPSLLKFILPGRRAILYRAR
jgi:hypothetical protein